MKPAGVLLALALVFAACGPSEGVVHKKPHGGGDGGVGGNSCVAPPADSDGDGISDLDEGGLNKPPTDSDGDGIPDYKDADSDNDGIPDAVEGRNATPCEPPVDSDGDGKPDFRDLDSDDPKDATIPDHLEAGADFMHPVDTNGDGKPDYMDPDDDGDGLPDKVELVPQGQAVAALTLQTAPDTDGDGVPDFRDPDADNDGILDGQDGAVDTDGDGLPNFRDLDSDGDCIPDAIEAGDANLMTAPVDTDNDGTPDFEDLDSDNDGLVDHKEDLNCNGTLDACETSRILTDTDGDGISDLIEVEDCAIKPPAQQAACKCDGSNPMVSPITLGDFVFTVDYMQPPSPASETLSLSTNIEQADVLFVFDTTSSQDSAIAAVRTGFQAIVTSVQSKVKDIGFGVFEFRDMGDSFVTRYDYRLTTANTTNSPTVAAVQAAIGALVTGGGGDGPEAGWPALYSVAGGPAISVSNYSSAITLASVTPTTPPAGESQGSVGGAGFRAGSVPIVVTVSDAGWHDAFGQTTGQIDPTTGKADAHAGYWDYDSSLAGSPSRESTIHLLQGLGAHVIGVSATNATGATNDTATRVADTAYDTGAVVTPADFGTMRPAGCAANQCCTGVSGVGIAPDAAGLCPLAFQYDDGNGAGIGSAVSTGIVALANGLKFDIHVEAKNVDPNTIENFMLELKPNVSGTGPAAMCVVVPTASLQDNFTGPKATPGKDGVPDTFPGVVNGQLVCFDVVPKINTTVMNTSQPQFFHATLQAKGAAPGGAMLNLGTPRDVFFLVPPKVVNGPIQ